MFSQRPVAFIVACERLPFLFLTGIGHPAVALLLMRFNHLCLLPSLQQFGSSWQLCLLIALFIMSRCSCSRVPGPFMAGCCQPW